MRILVVGAGSVGGYLGGRLAAAGRDVTFLVRPGRAAQLRKDGLRIVSPHGDLTLAPKLVLAPEIDGPYDLVLLAVKSYGLDGAIEDCAPAVGPQTMVLPILNGMAHLDTLVARFGDAAVLGGSTRLSTDLDSAGRILQLGDFNDLFFGERSGSITPRIEALRDTLNDVGFDAILSPDVIGFMWQKWTMLAASGAITCLLRGTVGDIVAAPYGRDTAVAIIDECAAIAGAAGHPMSEAAMKFTYEYLTRTGSPFTASMYRDLQKGAAVEAGQILGDLLAHGSAHGVDTPLVRAAYVQLAVYQANRPKRVDASSMHN
ncbi:MAG TPA: ketopantoate reductase family protein [Acidobacteriaceae bacterium]|nr:ketopantoate reductase family protein [Acidobacteriaceae bacterium]